MFNVQGLSRKGWGPVLFLLAALAFSGAQAPAAQAASCSPTSSINGAYTVLTFTSIGTCTWTVPSGTTTVNVLIVAGGGGGGGDAAGGGGGGGVYANSNYSVTPLVAETVTVGAGGTGGQCSSGNSASCTTGGGWPVNGYVAPTAGNASIFDVVTAPGGGAGGVYSSNAGGNGGSGGGGGASSGSGGSATATGSNFYGSNGGAANGSGGGGGGGAGHVGITGGPGAGGDGYQSTITGINTYYAGGGGGGGSGSRALGGNGGGGAGSTSCSYAIASPSTPNSAQAGSANSGGGGGGAPYGCPGSAANGGSGVVIISFLTALPTISLMALGSGLKTATYRAVNIIQVQLSSDARVKFYAQGKAIPGCANIQSISSVATCNWRPSVHGSIQITARVISGSSTSALNLTISGRSGNR